MKIIFDTLIMKSWWNRFLTVTFAIASVWCLADYLKGELTFNWKDDLVCLAVGLLAERVVYYLFVQEYTEVTSDEN